MKLSEYFLTLPPNKQYDLMSAQRGCDVPSSQGDIMHSMNIETNALRFTKEMIVGRVRAIIWDGLYGTTTRRVVELDDVLNLEGRLSQLLSATDGGAKLVHYLIHLVDAICASQEHEIWGGHASKIRIILENASIRAKMANEYEGRLYLW